MPSAGVLIALLVFTPAVPADDLALLREAEAAFHVGTSAATPETQAAAFRQAGDRYEELRLRGYQSAALYRNQGNAYLLADDVPRAILAFRRGLRITPGDADLQAGLAHARARVLYPDSDSFGRPPVEHWPPSLPHPSLGTLLGLAAIFYMLACFGVARWFLLRRRAVLIFAIATLLLACLPTAAVIAACVERRDAITYPIVMIAEDNVTLRKGPGQTYGKRSDLPLHRGVEARLRFERAGWLQIQLAGGEVGWLPREAAIVDE